MSSRVRHFKTSTHDMPIQCAAPTQHLMQCYMAAIAFLLWPLNVLVWANVSIDPDFTVMLLSTLHPFLQCI